MARLFKFNFSQKVMATGTIYYHINPKNVVIFDENEFPQQVSEKEEKATV